MELEEREGRKSGAEFGGCISLSGKPASTGKSGSTGGGVRREYDARTILSSTANIMDNLSEEVNKALKDIAQKSIEGFKPQPRVTLNEWEYEEESEINPITEVDSLVANLFKKEASSELAKTLRDAERMVEEGDLKSAEKALNVAEQIVNQMENVNKKLFQGEGRFKGLTEEIKKLRHKLREALSTEEGRGDVNEVKSLIEGLRERVDESVEYYDESAKRNTERISEYLRKESKGYTYLGYLFNDNVAYSMEEDINRAISTIKDTLDEYLSKIMKDRRKREMYREKMREYMDEVSQYIYSNIQRQKEKMDRKMKEMVKSDILTVPLEDVARLGEEEAVEALKRQLRMALSQLKTVKQRKRTVRARRIDMRGTIKKARQTGGVPLDLVYRKRKPGKENVIWLIDVSGSLQPYLPLIETIANSLKDIGLNVKTYYFVGELYEPDDPDIEWMGSTDLGNSFKEFLEKEKSLHDKTVIVFSDFRISSGSHPLPYIKDIEKKAKKLIILDPDEAPYTGDSVLEDVEEELKAKPHFVRTIKDVIEALKKEGY